MSAVTPQPASTLLSLPYELREPILHHLLQSPNTTAPSWINDIIPTRDQRNTRDNQWKDYSLQPWPPSPVLVAGKYLYSSSAALLTCHQLHNEIKDLVSRHPKHFPYHLDLIMAIGPSCIPTWLSLPAPPSFYKEHHDLSLDVDLRLEAVTRKEALLHIGDGRSYLHWGGCGGLPIPLVILLWVLSHWLKSGPRFHGTLNPSISAAELRIHFVVYQDGVVDEEVRQAWVRACVPDIHSWQARPDDREGQLNHHLGMLSGWMHILAISGLLFGRFRSLSVDVKGFEEGEKPSIWQVKNQTEEQKRATSLEWAGYGWLAGDELRRQMCEQERE